jgi:hypothetical protein
MNVMLLYWWAVRAAKATKFPNFRAQAASPAGQPQASLQGKAKCSLQAQCRLVITGPYSAAQHLDCMHAQ